MSTFEVIKALPQDIGWITQAQVLMAKETENLELNPKEVVKGVRFIFANTTRGFYVVVKLEQQVVACLMVLNEWSDWRNGDVWWIHSVYVLPAYRKLGIFKKMYEYVEDLARSSDVRGLRLYVDKSNLIAHKVYEKLGMSKDHYELFEKMF